MKREKKDGILDRKRVEGLFEIGPDGRPRRLEIVREGVLVMQQIVAMDVVYRAVRSPEPGQRCIERANDVLRRCYRDVPLIAAAAEENDDCHCVSIVRSGSRVSGVGRRRNAAY